MINRKIIIYNLYRKKSTSINIINVTRKTSSEHFFSYIKLNFYFIKTSFIRLWTNIWAGSCTMMSWSSLPYLHYNYRLLVNILMSLMSVVFFLLDLTHKPKPYYHRLPYTWACVSSEKIWINEVNFSYMNTLSIWKKKKKTNSKNSFMTNMRAKLYCFICHSILYEIFHSFYREENRRFFFLLFLYSFIESACDQNVLIHPLSMPEKQIDLCGWENTDNIRNTSLYSYVNVDIHHKKITETFFFFFFSL